MRTAHRVWSGVFACTFVLVAAVQCSGQQDTASGSAPRLSAAAPTTTTAPPRDPTLGADTDLNAGVPRQVRKVVSVRDIQFTDGTTAHVDVSVYAEGGSPGGWERCADRLRLAAAHRLLDGKTVTYGRDTTVSGYGTPDWVRLRGYDAYSAETNYERALDDTTTQRVMDECYPRVDSAPSSSGSDVNVDVDHDSDHRGPIERRVCRKTWLC